MTLRIFPRQWYALFVTLQGADVGGAVAQSQAAAAAVLDGLIGQWEAS